jgi:hypothetical protein
MIKLTLPDSTTVEPTVIPHDLDATHRTVTFAYGDGHLYFDITIMRWPGNSMDEWFASGHVSFHPPTSDGHLGDFQIHADDLGAGEPLVPVPLTDDDEIAVELAAWWLREHPTALAENEPAAQVAPAT